MTNPITGLPAGLDSLAIGNQETKASKDKLGQEEFLSLMVAQLENQNPLEPMENGEFLAQMAQFGTVQGIGDLQGSFGELATALQSSQALQASTMVGRQVLIPGSSASFSGGSGIAGAAELPVSATDVVVSIEDTNGQLIRRIPLGLQQAGLVEFNWDGTTNSGAVAPEGVYNIRVEATMDGANTAVPVFVQARVDSVTLQGGGNGVKLNLAEHDAVDIAVVRQIK